MDKGSQDAIALAPKSVRQGDANALRLDFSATHAAIAASIVATSDMVNVNGVCHSLQFVIALF